MKYSKSAIGLLTAQYRSVLKKCWMINVGLFALGGALLTATPAEAADQPLAFKTTTQLADGNGNIIPVGSSIGTATLTSQAIRDALGADSVINASHATSADTATSATTAGEATYASALKVDGTVYSLSYFAKATDYSALVAGTTPFTKLNVGSVQATGGSGTLTVDGNLALTSGKSFSVDGSSLSAGTLNLGTASLTSDASGAISTSHLKATTDLKIGTSDAMTGVDTAATEGNNTQLITSGAVYSAINAAKADAAAYTPATGTGAATYYGGTVTTTSGALDKVGTDLNTLTGTGANSISKKIESNAQDASFNKASYAAGTIGAAIKANAADLTTLKGSGTGSISDRIATEARDAQFVRVGDSSASLGTADTINVAINNVADATDANTAKFVGLSATTVQGAIDAAKSEASTFEANADLVTTDGIYKDAVVSGTKVSIAGALNAAGEQIEDNTDAITKLNGADTVTDSVKYSVKNLADAATHGSTTIGDAIDANAQAITKLNDAKNATGSVSYKIDQEAAKASYNASATDYTAGTIGKAIQDNAAAIKDNNDKLAGLALSDGTAATTVQAAIDSARKGVSGKQLNIGEDANEVRLGKANGDQFTGLSVNNTSKAISLKSQGSTMITGMDIANDGKINLGVTSANTLHGIEISNNGNTVTFKGTGSTDVASITDGVLTAKSATLSGLKMGDNTASKISSAAAISSEGTNDTLATTSAVYNTVKAVSDTLNEYATKAEVHGSADVTEVSLGEQAKTVNVGADAGVAISNDTAKSAELKVKTGEGLKNAVTVSGTDIKIGHVDGSSFDGIVYSEANGVVIGSGDNTVTAKAGALTAAGAIKGASVEGATLKATAATGGLMLNGKTADSIDNEGAAPTATSKSGTILASTATVYNAMVKATTDATKYTPSATLSGEGKVYHGVTTVTDGLEAAGSAIEANKTDIAANTTKLAGLTKYDGTTDAATVQEALTDYKTNLLQDSADKVAALANGAVKNNTDAITLLNDTDDTKAGSVRNSVKTGAQNADYNASTEYAAGSIGAAIKANAARFDGFDSATQTVAEYVDANAKDATYSGSGETKVTIAQEIAKKANTADLKTAAYRDVAADFTPVPTDYHDTDIATWVAANGTNIADVTTTFKVLSKKLSTVQHDLMDTTSNEGSIAYVLNGKTKDDTSLIDMVKKLANEAGDAVYVKQDDLKGSITLGKEFDSGNIRNTAANLAIDTTARTVSAEVRDDHANTQKIELSDNGLVISKTAAWNDPATTNSVTINDGNVTADGVVKAEGFQLGDNDVTSIDAGAALDITTDVADADKKVMATDAAVKATVKALAEGAVKDNTDAIALLNDADTKAGSVKNSIKTLASDATYKADSAEGSIGAAIATNTADIAANKATLDADNLKVADGSTVTVQNAIDYAAADAKSYTPSDELAAEGAIFAGVTTNKAALDIAGEKLTTLNGDKTVENSVDYKVYNDAAKAKYDDSGKTIKAAIDEASSGASDALNKVLNGTTAFSKLNLGAASVTGTGDNFKIKNSDGKIMSQLLNGGYYLYNNDNANPYLTATTEQLNLRGANGISFQVYNDTGNVFTKGNINAEGNITSKGNLTLGSGDDAATLDAAGIKQITTNKDAIDLLNGEEGTTGSVKNSIKTLAEDADYTQGESTITIGDAIKAAQDAADSKTVTIGSYDAGHGITAETATVSDGSADGTATMLTVAGAKTIFDAKQDWLDGFTGISSKVAPEVAFREEFSNNSNIWEDKDASEESHPTTIAGALRNIDSNLGTIHGLAAKLGQNYKGNLASGSSVEDHLTALDTSIGNRAQYISSHYANTTAEAIDNATAIANMDTAIFDAISDIQSDYVTKEYFNNGDDTNNAISMGSGAKNITIGHTSTDDTLDNGTTLTVDNETGKITAKVFTGTDGTNPKETATLEMSKDGFKVAHNNKTVSIADGSVTAAKFVAGDDSYADAFDNAGTALDITAEITDAEKTKMASDATVKATVKGQAENADYTKGETPTTIGAAIKTNADNFAKLAVADSGDLVHGSNIIDGTVTHSKIANNSVWWDQLSGGVRDKINSKKVTVSTQTVGNTDGVEVMKVEDGANEGTTLTLNGANKIFEAKQAWMDTVLGIDSAANAPEDVTKAEMTGTNYLTEAASFTDAFKKLDSALGDVAEGYVSFDYFNGENPDGSAVIMGRSSDDIEIGKQNFDSHGVPTGLQSGIKITNGTANTIEIGNYNGDAFNGIEVSNAGKTVTVKGQNKDVTIVDGDITTAGKVQATKLELSDGASTPTITEATAIDNAGTVMTAAPADGKTLASTLTVYNNVQDATVFKAAEVTANTHNYAAGDTVKQAIASLDGVVGDIHTYTSSHYANPTADDKDLSTAIKNLDTALFDVTKDYVTKTYFNGGDDTDHFISMGSLAKKVTIGADNSARIVLDVTDDANKSITMTAGTDMQVAVNGTEITIGDKDGQGIKVDNDGKTTTFAGSTDAKKVVVEEGVVTASDGVIVGTDGTAPYSKIEKGAATFAGENKTVSIADGSVTIGDKLIFGGDNSYATGIDNTWGKFTAAPANNYTLATTKTVYDNTYLTAAGARGNYAAGSVLDAVASIDKAIGNRAILNGTNYANPGDSATTTNLSQAIKNIDDNVFAKVGTVDLSTATNYANTTATPATNLTQAVVNIDKNVKQAIDDLDGKFVTKNYFNGVDEDSVTPIDISMGSKANTITIGKTSTTTVGSDTVTTLTNGVAINNTNNSVVVGRQTVDSEGVAKLQTGMNVNGENGTIDIASVNGTDNSSNGISMDKDIVKIGTTSNGKFEGISIQDGVMTNADPANADKKATFASDKVAVTDGENTASMSATTVALADADENTADLTAASLSLADADDNTADLTAAGLSLEDAEENTADLTATGLSLADADENTADLTAAGLSLEDAEGNTADLTAASLIMDDTDNKTTVEATGVTVENTDDGTKTTVASGSIEVTDTDGTTKITGAGVETGSLKLGNSTQVATAISDGSAVADYEPGTEAEATAKATLATNATVKATVDGIVADIEKQIHGDKDHPETPVTIGEYADNTIIGKVSTDTTQPLNTDINVDTKNNKITLETADISNDKQTSTGIELDNKNQTIGITSANGKLGTETGLKITNEGADDQHLIELTYTHKGQDDKVDTERGLVMDADEQTYSLGSTDVAGKTFSGLAIDAAENTYTLGKGTIDDQGDLTLDYGMTMDAEEGITSFADKDGNGVTMNKGDMTVTDSATVGSVDAQGVLSGVKLDKTGNAQASASATVGQVDDQGALDGNGVQLKNDGSATFASDEGDVEIADGAVTADNSVTVGDNTADDYIDLAKQDDGSYKATFASADGNVEIAGGNVTADNKVTAKDIEAKNSIYVGDPAGEIAALYKTGLVAVKDADNQATYGSGGMWAKAGTAEGGVNATGMWAKAGTAEGGVNATGLWTQSDSKKSSYGNDGLWIGNKAETAFASLNERALYITDGTDTSNIGLDGIYTSQNISAAGNSYVGGNSQVDGVATFGKEAGKQVVIDSGDVTADGTVTGDTLVANTEFELAGTKVHSIDTGTAKVEEKGDVLATTASIFRNAEDGDYNAAEGTYTTVDAETINEALAAVDKVIGDFPNGLNYENHNLDNGGKAEPKTIVDAFNNIDATLGQIHGLAAKVGVENGSMNLGQNTTVEEHLTALAGSIGNRTSYTEQNVIKNNESTAKSLDALDMAVGDVSKLQGTTYANAGNLSDAVVQIDDKLQNLDGRVESVEHDLKDVHHELRRGMASMAAMSALVPNSRSTGKTSLSLGTGAYSGHNAVAVGGFHYLTDNLMLNAGAAWSNSRDAVYRVGVTYSF